MAFENLSEKLQNTFKKLRGKGVLTEADINEAMREVKLALLEADVNFKVVKEFVAQVKEKVGVPKALVFISTVAVYGCEFGDLITEEHPLNGDTPYAKSKIMAEEYLSEWCKKHGVSLGILRPSLLAGKNAPGNLGAMVNGVRKGFNPSCDESFHGQVQGLRLCSDACQG